MYGTIINTGPFTKLRNAGVSVHANFSVMTGCGNMDKKDRYMMNTLMGLMMQSNKITFNVNSVNNDRLIKLSEYFDELPLTDMNSSYDRYNPPLERLKVNISFRYDLLHYFNDKNIDLMTIFKNNIDIESENLDYMLEINRLYHDYQRLYDVCPVTLQKYLKYKLEALEELKARIMKKRSLLIENYK